jgi:hypothetical protein
MNGLKKDFERLEDERINMKITGNKEGIHPWNYKE